MALDREYQRREADEDREAHYYRTAHGINRAAAIRRFRGRCKATLLRDLTWPADPVRRANLVDKCARELETIARHVYARGWLLQEERLGQLVRSCLESVAVAQRAGKIREFWPYYRRAVWAFVGVHAEEIQALAKRDGADVASSMESLVAGLAIPGLARPVAPSMTEILAERPELTKPTPDGFAPGSSKPSSSRP